MINILHYRLGGKCFTKDLSANLPITVSSCVSLSSSLDTRNPAPSILATQLLYRTPNF